MSVRKFSVKTIVAIVVLSACLAGSLLANVYFHFRLQHSSPTFFSFVWGPTAQKLVNGTLHLNLTFDVADGNLTVKAEVNAERYNPDVYLALQFDSDNNGTIDIRYWPEEDIYVYEFWEDDSQFLLRVNNQTRPSCTPYWGWLPNGEIWCSSSFSGVFEHESSFHRCRHNYNSGIYTFDFSVPINPTSHAGEHDLSIWWLTGKYGIQGKLVRVLYGILPLNGSPEKGLAVYVPPFNFRE